jgi:hypothetical protein
MTEFEIGDTVRFVNQRDMIEYIGEIVAYYEHNKKYEIQIEEWVDEEPEVIPEVGVTDTPLEKLN